MGLRGWLASLESLGGTYPHTRFACEFIGYSGGYCVRTAVARDWERLPIRRFNSALELNRSKNIVHFGTKYDI